MGDSGGCEPTNCGVSSMLTRGMKLNLSFALVACALGASYAQPYDKVVEDFFNSTDPFIKGTVIPNIEANRKSNAQVTLTDKDGKPLAGVKVSVKQLEH